MTKKKKILIGFLAFMVIAQFIRIDKTNPKVDQSKDFGTIENTDKELFTLIKSSCYDCHSNETVYPWYSNVAPVSWFLKGHIKGARQQVNFSTWGDYSIDDQQHAIRECIEVLEEKRMPMKSYVWMHKDAKLSEQDRDRLMIYFSSLKK